MKNDLLYTIPKEEVQEEIKLLGGIISDASDFIHQERISIDYPANKSKEYFDILRKNNYLRFSLSYRLK